MNIISWDIGIKNLAYCVISQDLNTICDKCYVTNCYNKVTNKYTHYNHKVYSCDFHKKIYKILKVINKKTLSNTLNDIISPNSYNKCYINSCNNKTTKMCKYYGHNIYWCKNHKYIYKKLYILEKSNLSQLDFQLSEKLNIDNNKVIHNWDIINLIKDPNKCYVKKCKKNATKFCKYLKHNIYWCDTHNHIYDYLQKLDKSNNQLNYNNNLTIPKKIKIINCNNINIDNLRLSLIHKLDHIILPLIFSNKINHVLIENQPAMKNPKMKAIADILYAWFLIRGVIDSKLINGIHLISPSNKLKQYSNEIIGLSNINIYKSTKLKSIQVVKKLFKNNKWLLHLDKYNKQDDLCDSLLQGLYWIDKCNKTKN